MEHLLFAWLTSQPEEIQALLHALSLHGNFSLSWDSLHRHPAAHATPEGARVLASLGLPLTIVTMG